MVVAVVCVKLIVPVPKLIDLVVELFELNIPVLNVKVPNANVPLVNIVVLVKVKVNVSPNVVVPDVLLIVKFTKVVLPLLVIVPVPTMLAVKLVYTPAPELNVNPFKFNVVTASVNAVEPKLNVLNQLPVDRTGIAVPVPVIDRLGELVIVPPDVDPTL